MEYIMIFIVAVFVNNVVLSQFLGICPFLGVSKKVETSIGMGAAVTFVLAISTIVTYLIQKFVLDPFGLGFMQTISFILVIAALVQMVEIILKKVSPALYQALGIFLPLITTNCCVLGVAILVIQKDYNLLESVVYAISTALGFALALIIFAGIREQLSVAYAGMGMKRESDYNRNVYLDILYNIRQDKELESRYWALAEESAQLNFLIHAMGAGVFRRWANVWQPLLPVHFGCKVWKNSDTKNFFFLAQ